MIHDLLLELLEHLYCLLSQTYPIETLHFQYFRMALLLKQTNNQRNKKNKCYSGFVVETMVCLQFSRHMLQNQFHGVVSLSFTTRS